MHAHGMHSCCWTHARVTRAYARVRRGTAVSRHAGGGGDGGDPADGAARLREGCTALINSINCKFNLQFIEFIPNTPRGDLADGAACLLEEGPVACAF